MRCTTIKNVSIFLIIALVPLVVHLHEITVPKDLAFMPLYYTDLDIFTWWRATVLIILSFFLIPFCKFNWFAFIYLFCLMLSTLFSHSPYLSIWGVPNYNEGALALACYMIIFMSQPKFTTVKWAIYFSVMFVGAVGLIQYFHGGYLDVFHSLVGAEKFWEWGRPLYSTLLQPNHLGLYCALLFPFLLSLRAWAPLLLLSFLTFGCESRGCWLSVGITSILILRKKAVYLLVLLAILAIPFKHEVKRKMQVTYHDFHWPIQNSALSGRWYIWKNALPLLEDKIIIGNGPGTFISDFPNAPDKPFPEDMYMDRPHNVFIQVWHATGPLSLLALGMLVITYRGPQCIKISILGFLIAATFTDSMVGISGILFSLMGVVKSDPQENT